MIGVMVSLPPTAQAKYPLPLSVAAGCKQGKSFVRKWNREERELLDVEFGACYRRSKYTIVLEFTAYWTDSECSDRGLVTHWSDGYYRWRQYALNCY